MRKKPGPKYLALPAVSPSPAITIGTITYDSSTKVMTVPGTVSPVGTPVSGMAQNTTTHQSYMPTHITQPTAGGSNWSMTYTGLPSGTYNVQAYMTCSAGSASEQTQFTIP